MAHSVGSAMTYWILKENGMIVPRSTVRLLTEDERKNSAEIKNREKYNKMVHTKFDEYGFCYRDVRDISDVDYFIMESSVVGVIDLVL